MTGDETSESYEPKSDFFKAFKESKGVLDAQLGHAFRNAGEADQVIDDYTNLLGNQGPLLESYRDEIGSIDEQNQGLIKRLLKQTGKLFGLDNKETILKTLETQLARMETTHGSVVDILKDAHTARLDLSRYNSEITFTIYDTSEELKRMEDLSVKVSEEFDKLNEDSKNISDPGERTILREEIRKREEDIYHIGMMLGSYGRHIKMLIDTQESYNAFLLYIQTVIDSAEGVVGSVQSAMNGVRFAMRAVKASVTLSGKVKELKSLQSSVEDTMARLSNAMSRFSVVSLDSLDVDNSSVRLYSDKMKEGISKSAEKIRATQDIRNKRDYLAGKEALQNR